MGQSLQQGSTWNSTSAQAAMLPYMEQTAIYNSINFNYVSDRRHEHDSLEHQDQLVPLPVRRQRRRRRG